MKKILVCLLALISLFMLFTLGICATDSDGTRREWVLSADEKTLTYGDAVYRYCPNTPSLIIPDEMYVYEQEIACEALEDRYALIMHNLHNKDIIMIVDRYDRIRIYVNEAGQEIMNLYLMHNFEDYVCYEKPMRAAIPTELVKALANGTHSAITKTLSVTTLKDLTKYTIYGLDQTHTLGHMHGAIYEINDEFWYLNYDALDNSYFDSEGDFSYRRGTVTLTKVDTDIMVFDVLAYAEEFHIQYVYEENESTLGLNKDGATVIFVLTTVILLFLLPAVPLILSLVFVLIKQNKKRRRWLLLLLLSALWLVLSIVILLLILLS